MGTVRALRRVLTLGALLPLAFPVRAQDAADAGTAPLADVGAVEADAGAVEADAGAQAPVVMGLVAPRLRQEVPAAYPESERATYAEPSVLLRVSLDAAGKVVAAEVVESAGAAFDEAAQAAALQFVFEPATRDGTPIAARVPLRIAFRRPVDAMVAAPAAPPLSATLPSPPAAPPPAAPPAQPLQVTVRGERSTVEQRLKSSDAVAVVDLARAKRRSSDLGEVLARTAGISVRRFGGLGSEYRLALNGLYDSAVRVFIDNVPIDRVYAMNMVNVPVNLVENVEIYRGVVPLRLGADALGGAMNIVTPQKYETVLQASYQVSSFNMHRATLAGRYRHEPSNFVVGVEAFYDHADNSYWVDVEIPDERGRLSPARVRRFHDGYGAYGVAVEAGVVEKPWARKLIARAFTSEYDKEQQSNIVMTVPYGSVRYGESIRGALLIYQNTFADILDLELVGSYAYRTIDFVDKGRWVYDWRGRRVRERSVRGEIEAEPTDQTVWQHAGFARANVDLRLAPGHILTLTASPSFPSRTGDERIQVNPDDRDPLTAERKLFKHVNGLGYTLGLQPLASAPTDAPRLRPEHYRLENMVFLKTYHYRIRAEDPLPGNTFRRRDRENHYVGFGDTLRVTLVDDWLLTKVSYEYAIRLPETDEVFGNGVLVMPNLGLNPELSHNANFGPQLDLRKTDAGEFWLDLNFFLRESDQMMVLLGNDRFFSWQNVYGARTLGVDSHAKWTSPQKLVTVEGSFSYTDQRNTSSSGTFGNFKGDRIPNRPPYSASWGGWLHFAGVLSSRDTVEPFYAGRWVSEFYRGWESLGIKKFKQVIETQISHDIGVTYNRDFARGRLYATLEATNLADAKLFDNFGLQKPGRSYGFKLTGDLQ
jgi:TonB family protein